MQTKRKCTPIKGTAIVADTNIFINNPNVVDSFRENGNTLVIPLTVIMELNRLKERADIGFDAREVAKKIEKIQDNGDSSLIIFRNPNFKNIGDLNKNTPDHQIIATALALRQKTKEFAFDRVRLISRDRIVRILGKKFGLGLIEVEDYTCEQAELSKHRLIEIPGTPENICHNSLSFPYDPYVRLNIEENEGVLFDEEFIAIRKGNQFNILPPDINAAGIFPYTLNGKENWQQHIALGQLLDRNIRPVA